MCFKFSFKTMNVLRLFNICQKFDPPPWSHTTEGSTGQCFSSCEWYDQSLK